MRSDVEAVEQVLAEAARRDLGLEVAVGGRDDPHVDLDRVAPPTGVELAAPASTRSSFACSVGGSSPISSRNSVPPSAASNAPVARCDRAGEGAALVAEQLALEQRLGDGAAVERDERPPARCGGGWSGATLPCRCRSRR